MRHHGHTLQRSGRCHTVTTHFFTDGNQGMGTRLLSSATTLHLHTQKGDTSILSSSEMDPRQNSKMMTPRLQTSHQGPSRSYTSVFNPSTSFLWASTRPWLAVVWSILWNCCRIVHTVHHIKSVICAHVPHVCT